MNKRDTEQHARLSGLATIEDDPDTSDIPEAPPGSWAAAEIERFYRPKKEAVTIRLDADVLQWFRSRAEGERGYQTAINAALRRYIEQKR